MQWAVECGWNLPSEWWCCRYRLTCLSRPASYAEWCLFFRCVHWNRPYSVGSTAVPSHWAANACLRTASVDIEEHRGKEDHQELQQVDQGPSGVRDVVSSGVASSGKFVLTVRGVIVWRLTIWYFEISLIFPSYLSSIALLCIAGSAKQRNMSLWRIHVRL